MSQKYADILHLSRPTPSRKHPRMSLQNRAKLFSPFAALRGYEEEIVAEGEAHLHTARAELSDERLEQLGSCLSRIQKGRTVTVRFFAADSADSPKSAPSPEITGHCQTVTGRVDRVDFAYRKLWLYTGVKTPLGKERPLAVSFEDILELSVVS